MQALKVFLSVLIFIVLTAITQVGGIIYLLWIPVGRLINKKIAQWFYRFLARLGSFLLIYLLFTFLIIPALAKKAGRVALPVMETGHIQPLHFYTCILNRHYVKPELKEALLLAANKLHNQFSSTVINYLDAGFPFLDGFPLLPHLSHNDGKKVDLAFRYKDAVSGNPVNGSPSAWGYGVCEEPNAAEVSTATFCRMKGYKQYSAMKDFVSQADKKNYLFDEEQTRALIQNLVAIKTINTIFIEPHLKIRMDLDDKKIKFQGCHSVRHDDHIHVQIK